MTRTRCIDNKSKTPEIRQIYPPGTTKTKSPVAFTKLNLGDQRSGRRKKRDSEGDVKLREIASQKIAEILSQ